MSRFLLQAILLSGPLVFPTATPGTQNVTLDEGAFSVTMAGMGSGTETFTIRRAGSGTDVRVISQARIQWSLSSGSRSVEPLLEARGPRLALYAYQVKVSGDRQEEVYMRVEGRRFVANIRSEAGEQQREFRARPGSILLERGVAHHYFLLGGVDSSPVPVLVPLAGRQEPFTVTTGDRETVRVGGESVEALHVTLEGEDERHEVWLDDEGRVLRVEIPAAGYVASRQALPRS